MRYLPLLIQYAGLAAFMAVTRWRLIDAWADWLRHTFGPQAQLRFGVLLVLASIPLMVYGPFSDEQFLIYEMSAAALLVTGIGIVVTAETLKEVATDDPRLEDEPPED